MQEALILLSYQTRHVLPLAGWIISQLKPQEKNDDMLSTFCI